MLCGKLSWCLDSVGGWEALAGGGGEEETPELSPEGEEEPALMIEQSIDRGQLSRHRKWLGQGSGMEMSSALVV